MLRTLVAPRGIGIPQRKAQFALSPALKTWPRRAFAFRLSSGAAIAFPPPKHFTPIMIDEPKSDRSRRSRSVRRSTYGSRDV